MSHPTVSIVFPAKLIGFAAARGVDTRPLWQSTGLSGSEPMTPETRVAAEVLYDVWAQVMRALRDPGLPIELSQTYRIEDLHVMGFAIMASSDARQAIERVTRYSVLLNTAGRWEADESGQLATVRWVRVGPLELGHRTADEAAVSTFLHTFRQIAGERFVPDEVCFKHRAPPDVSAHQAHYDLRPTFGAGYTGFRFAKRLLDTMPRTANPSLAAFIDEQARRLMPHAAAANLRSRVKNAIAQELASGIPAMTVIARRLAMSERSLRRALADEETSFRDVVAEARMERARDLLRERGVSVGEVAFLLGFSDASAFTRAFKRAAGVSPSEFRESA